MSPQRLLGAILVLFIISTASLKRESFQGVDSYHLRGNVARSAGFSNLPSHFNNFGERGAPRNQSTHGPSYFWHQDGSHHSVAKSDLRDRKSREHAVGPETSKWQYEKYHSETDDKPIVKMAAFGWPQKHPFDFMNERPLPPHSHFGHFRNEAHFRFRGPSFPPFGEGQMRPNHHGGNAYQETGIRNWHVEPSGREPEESSGRGEMHLKRDKERDAERPQNSEEMENERGAVQKDGWETRTSDETRETHREMSDMLHDSERSHQHYSEPLHSWKPIEESQVQKWHEGVANQREGKDREREEGHRPTEVGKTRKTEKDEEGSETIQTDVGETRLWEEPEKPNGINQAKPHDEYGPIHHWRPIEESQVRKWHEGYVSKQDKEDHESARDGMRDDKMVVKEEKPETIQTDVGETRVWEEHEKPHDKKAVRQHGDLGPIYDWSEDDNDMHEPEKVKDNLKKPSEDKPDEGSNHDLRDTQKDRHAFDHEPHNGQNEHKPEFYAPGMKPYFERHPPAPFPREPLQPPYLRPRIPDIFNPGNMDWFRQTPPGRLEPGRHPLDREERQDSKTSRLVSSKEKPSQTSLEAEKESPEKKRKLIVGPADKKSQNRLKVHFVAGGRPTSAPATISSTTTRHPYKATETMTTKAPIASATNIQSKQSLIIPAMAEGSQPAAREGGVHGKPQAQIVLNVYQDRYGKLNFELATDQTTRPSQKTEPRDEDDSSHKDDTERENKNAQHIRKAKNEGRSSMPEKQRYLVEKTSFVGEYPPPHGQHPHTHSRRMMIPHQERDHVPPLYSASFPSEYFDGFGRSNPPVPDFTNHQGHVYPHPPDDLFAVAHESHTEEPRLGKDRIHKPESGKEVHGDERDAKKLKSEPYIRPSRRQEAQFTTTSPAMVPTTMGMNSNRTAVALSDQGKKVNKASFSRKFDHLDDDDSFLETCYQNNCSNQCTSGVYKISPNTGCVTCDCCEEVNCYQYCEHGYEADEYGCPICECALPLDEGGFLL